MHAIYTILLLIVSNIFMTFAWYGHLKLEEMHKIDNWPLFGIILFRGALRWPNIPARFRPTASAL